MSDLDSYSLSQQSFSFKDIIGQRADPAPRTNPRTVTATTLVNPLDDLIQANATSGAITLTLETAVACDGRRHTFKKIDATANAVTIACTGGQTIDGAATKAIAAQYDTLTVISDGANWKNLNTYIAAGGGGGVTSVSGTAPVTSTGGATPAIGITDFVASGAAHARGAVPDPGAVAGSTKFLREDATWVTPTAAVAINQATIDFGTKPVSEMLFTVADGSVTPTSKIIAQIASVAPANRDLDEIQAESLYVFANPSATAGSGFVDFWVRTIDGSTVSEQFIINYQVGA
jgi:hypothetical protein